MTALGQDTSAKGLLKQSQALYAAKKYDSSLLIIDQLQQLQNESSDWSLQVKAALLKVSNHNRKRQNQERLNAASNALIMASKHLPSDTLYAEALRAKGDAFIRLGQFDSSLYYLKQAETRYFELQLWSEAAACQVGQGANFYRLKQFAQADTILSKAMQLMAERLETLPSLYGTANNLLGAAYQSLGDHEKALKNYLAAVRFHEKHTKNQQRLTYAYNNLGIAYSRRGDYDKAEEFLQLASISAQEQEPPDEASLEGVYSNLMLINTRQADLNTALDYAQRRTDIVEKGIVKPNARNQIKFFNNLGLLYIEIGSYTEAKAALEQALALDPERAQTQANLGYFHFRQHNTENAKKWLSMAIKSYGGTEEVSVSKLYRYRAMGASENGSPLESLGDFNKAIALLVPSHVNAEPYALPELKNIRSKRELLRTLTAKGKHMIAHQTPLEVTKNTLLTAIALADSMYYEHKAEGSRLFLKNEVLPLYESTLNLLATAYEKTQDSSLLKTAFTIIEKSKSSLLTDLLQVKNTNQLAGVPKEFIEQEQSLQIDIAFYEKEEYLAATKENNERQALYQQYRLNKINERDRLLERLEQEYPRYFAARHRSLNPSLEEARARLIGADELMIEYFVGSESTFALGLSSSLSYFFKLGPTAPIKSIAEQFMATITQPGTVVSDVALAYQVLTSSGTQLYDMLIRPVKDHFSSPTESLYLIPDGFLNYLPFEALLTTKPTSAGQNFIDLPYLIKQSSLRYGYAASLPQTRSGTSQNVLAMAPFGTQDLKNTSEEVRNIENYFGDGAFYPDSGSERAFKEQADDFGILHLATHGRLDTENPQLSHLAFNTSASDTEDDKLHVYELENMNLNAQLAVLSACETGTGNLVSGEGVMSLARAFSYTGVPSMVMSLWQVDDRSGSELINHFYAGLSQDLSKTDALRNAKLAYLENTDQLHAHPYFWSQFVLIGDPAPLKSSWGIAGFSTTIIVVSISLLLLIIFLLLHSKRSRYK